MNAIQLEKRRRRLVSGAIALLRQAAADGFKDAARLKRESAFDPIRFDPDFPGIAADIKFPARPLGLP